MSVNLYRYNIKRMPPSLINSTMTNALCELLGESESTGSVYTWIPDGLTQIKDGAFEGSGFSVASMQLPSSVTTIGARAFYGLERENIQILDTCKSIGEYAFFLMSPQFTTSYLTIGAKNIGTYAFGVGFLHTPPVKQLQILNTVEHIDSYAFSRLCVSTLILENGLTKLDDLAFAKMGNVQSKVIIPNSVTYIGDGCFIGEDRGYSVFGDGLYIPNSVKYFGPYCFSTHDYDGTVELEEGITTLSEFMFSGSTFTILKLPSTLTDVSPYTFADSFCNNLYINMPENTVDVTKWGFESIGKIVWTG